MKKTLTAITLVIAMTGGAYAKTQEEKDKSVNTALFGISMDYAMAKHDGIACRDSSALMAASTIFADAAEVLIEGGYGLSQVRAVFENQFNRHHDLAGDSCIEGSTGRAEESLRILPIKLDSLRKATRGEDW